MEVSTRNSGCEAEDGDDCQFAGVNQLIEISDWETSRTSTFGLAKGAASGS